jgi:hypothetical protein
MAEQTATNAAPVMAQTVAAIATSGTAAGDLNISAEDRALLRRLAARVAEIAARPVEQQKRELWYRHNSLEATRPVVFCDPENGWNEIITPELLACEGALAREWEMALCKEIFWGNDMRDDRVVLPCFSVRHVYAESDWGMHETKIGGAHGGAYTWESPLKSYDDLPKLRFQQITVDAEATRRVVELAQETLGDILTVKLKTAWWWTLGMTWTLVNLRGLSQMMYDMVDHPDELHQVMAFLRDGHMAKLDFLEQHDLLSLNNDGTYVGSGGFGWTQELPQPDFECHVRTRDMWGFAESQETVGVSPAMFEEFIFPYQLPILERFGLNCYGCCEPVDKRWHILEKIPRLRRVSVSPWASIAGMAERMGSRYIFSLKPNPAYLAMDTFDEDAIRAGLREAMQVCRAHDCRMEVIMKDCNTIHNDPRRAVRWVQIAREEAEAL